MCIYVSGVIVCMCVHVCECMCIHKCLERPKVHSRILPQLLLHLILWGKVSQ